VNIPSYSGCVAWAVTHGNCKLPTTCRTVAAYPDAVKRSAPLRASGIPRETAQIAPGCAQAALVHHLDDPTSQSMSYQINQRAAQLPSRGISRLSAHAGRPSNR
jgi:hypothetical protein